MKPAVRQRWRYVYTDNSVMTVEVKYITSGRVDVVVVQTVGGCGGHRVGSEYSSPGLEELTRDRHTADNDRWTYLIGQDAP